MLFSRKQFLRAAAGSVVGLAGSVRAADEMASRIARVIQEYDRQGIHRTGTAAERRSAEWLAVEARRCGARAALESYAHERVDPQLCLVEAAGRRVDGVPIFDAPFTDRAGVRGRLGAMGSEAEIGWIELPPNAEYGTTYEPARRKSRHKAVIVVSKGARPGLCLINAPEFSHPYGAPMLQIGSEHGDWLREVAARKEEVRVVAEAKRTTTRAWNVTATIRGTDASLRPLVVMTPRSGWWHSTGERGGGLACWLEVMRALAANRPARDVHFLSSSGHELGHLGLKDYLARRPQQVANAHVWLHFGANIGAVGAPNRIQALDDELEALAVAALAEVGVTVNDRARRGAVPFGEAGNIHRGGGRYLSLLCPANPLFHHPADRWPDAVNVEAVAKYAAAFARVALRLAQT
ncbi:MAG: hypothetical protein SF339_24840 [Blastocatellia bacterium]|nr:hypothetical protein [Blastocatellia bacterium]